jgi:hypothetical protein
MLFYSGTIGPGHYPEVVAAENVDSWHDAVLTALGLLEETHAKPASPDPGSPFAKWATSVVGSFVHGTITMSTEGGIPINGVAQAQLSRNGSGGEYLLTPGVEGLPTRLNRGLVQASLLRLADAVPKAVGEAAEEFLRRREAARAAAAGGAGFLYDVVQATPGGQSRLLERCGKCNEWWPTTDQSKPVTKTTAASEKLRTHLSSESHVSMEWLVAPGEMTAVAAHIETGQLKLGDEWRARISSAANEARPPLDDRLTELTLMYQAARGVAESSTTAHPKQVMALERLADAVDGLQALLELDEDDEHTQELLRAAAALRSSVGKLAVEMTMRDAPEEPAPRAVSTAGVADWMSMGLGRMMGLVSSATVPMQSARLVSQGVLLSIASPKVVRPAPKQPAPDVEDVEDDADDNTGIFTGSIFPPEEE